MNQYVFCIFILLVIIGLIVIYLRKKTVPFELFVCSPEQQQEMTKALGEATLTVISQTSDNQQDNNGERPKPARKSFIMYEDRYYLINTKRKIFCKYISGGDWFQLCDNYRPTDYVSTSLKDLTVMRDTSKKLYIYGLFGNYICRKLIDDSSDDWEYMTDLGLGLINQISSNKNSLLINILNSDDSEPDEEVPQGIYLYTIENNNLVQITDNTNYINIRVNPYSNDNFFYGLYKQENGDIIPVKRTFDSQSEEEDDYDDSFDFGEITFVDLCVTNNFLYGLGNDKYVYRKSIVVDMVGNESYSWNKVTTALSSNASLKNNINKKINVYNGYIYCLDNETVKKHRINGYSWIDVNDFDFENQYFTNSPTNILKRIHNDTDPNMDREVKYFIPMKPFKFGHSPP